MTSINESGISHNATNALPGNSDEPLTERDKFPASGEMVEVASDAEPILPKKWHITNTKLNPTVTVVYPELAAEIGLNESMMLVQLSYWINHSDNLKDGMYWTYQSFRDMQRKAFPYWGVATIRRIVQKLLDEEYIIVGQHNTRKGDKTQWYALNPEGCSRLKSIITLNDDREVFQNGTGCSKMEQGVPKWNRVFQNGTALPESTTKTTTDITQKEEQNLAGAQNAPAGVALKADEDGVIVEETPKSKDAWKNHADILKALATHVNGQLVAVIAAWKDNLLAPPVDGKNPYQNRTIRALALALLSEGYGKSHVERYVKGYYAPGSWWRDKPLSFQQVCERMPAWIAANPDPFEAQRKADEEWERYKASLNPEERAELAAQIEQDNMERG